VEATGKYREALKALREDKAAAVKFCDAQCAKRQPTAPDRSRFEDDRRKSISRRENTAETVRNNRNLRH
jgi:hypothetical protein